ncbi:anthranilate phosphoribosyltransferase [Tautonia rosea]|uniref:anthranilate phosphoribosyltransferase n=1 Tax=Tautonia rosea TaxID=2728037 RepID=UPI001F34A6E2|nr:anthranilate phosphoribosyltransferase [Tautonia rosea]
MLPSSGDCRSLQLALRQLGESRSISRELAFEAVSEIVAGQASEVLITAFLVGLRVKGESDEELAGAVDAVRRAMTPFDVPVRPVLDTCGTGGDGAASVNVSTASAIVVAASGVPVAKHGNRSASGVSGSSEVLEQLGVAIDPGHETQKRCLAELGLTFLFAPSFHPALRHVAGVRKQLPFRTLFNLVGPLANPARPEYQLVGVPDSRLAQLIANALARLGITRAAVVSGPEGLDEVGLSGPTQVIWIEGNRVESRTWLPAEFGLPETRADELRVSDSNDSADLILRMLEGEPGPVRSVVLANAAAALMVAGHASRPAEGVSQAAEAIDSGKARDLLDRWIRLTHPST